MKSKLAQQQGNWLFMVHPPYSKLVGVITTLPFLSYHNARVLLIVMFNKFQLENLKNPLTHCC
jgi:hypothetical protein